VANNRAGSVMKAMGYIVIAILASLSSSVIAAEANFNAEKIPFVSEKKRGELLDSYTKNTQKTTFTLAVSTDGKKTSWFAGSSITSEERELLALQNCEHTSGAPCVLVVKDGVMTGDTVPGKSVMKYPTEFAVSDVPFIGEKGRDWVAGYLRAPKHKAIAMRGNGAMAVATEKASEEEAQNEALSRCLERVKKTCFVYAVDNRVLFNKSSDITPK